jgi:transposase
VSALSPAAPDCAACAARDARIAELEDLAGELREAVGAQADQIAALREQVERLGRAQSRNSGNSSMPPSSDDVPGRTPPRKQRRTEQQAAGKRTCGKQPGAHGAAMRWEDPDQIIPHFPRGQCRCGRDLREARDLGVASSAQQLDIPEPRARRIQHDMHAARCACGREHVAARPPGVPDAALAIGPGLRALAVYLLVYQHIPVERCRQLITDVAGAEVSGGFIHSCLRKAASALAGVVKLIKALITAAHVAGFDETTLRAGKAGTKKYVQGAFTERYTALFPGERTLKSFRKFGILPDFAGVTVTDRYVNYWHSGWKHIAGDQACLAHLLRNSFKYASKRDWAQSARDLKPVYTAASESEALGLVRRIQRQMGKALPGHHQALGERLGRVRAIPAVRPGNQDGHLHDQRHRIDHRPAAPPVNARGHFPPDK